MRPDSWCVILVILDFWYSIFDTPYLILNICHSISDTWFWHLDTETFICASFYLLPVTFYLLLIIVWYLLIHDFWFFLYGISYLKLAITCKIIVSFRSCSATRSCYHCCLDKCYCNSWNQFKIVPWTMNIHLNWRQNRVSNSWDITDTEFLWWVGGG